MPNPSPTTEILRRSLLMRPVFSGHGFPTRKLNAIPIANPAPVLTNGRRAAARRRKKMPLRSCIYLPSGQSVVVPIVADSRSTLSRSTGRLQRLQQPRHVPPEGSHRRHPLLVLLHLADLAADPDVPVARPGDDHLPDEEEVVHRIEVVDRS